MYVPAWQGLTLGHFTAPPMESSMPFPSRSPHRRAFHTARSAIYHLFRTLVALGRKRVLAPDYHMGNELRAIRAAGAQVQLYRIGRFGQPEFDERFRQAVQGADVLFTIHYAGWPQPILSLRQFCDRYGLVLVEDCALALLSEIDGQPLGSFGDYSVFCLYKTLAVMDGGLLVQNRTPFATLDRLPLRRIGRAFEAGKVAELWVEHLRSRAPQLGAALSAGKRTIGALMTACHIQRVPVGDIGFDVAHTQWAMSSWSSHLLRRLDFPVIRRRRRRNFTILGELLGAHGIEPWLDLEPGVCPLFFPLLVKDKSTAARSLQASGVMATELWNTGDPVSADQEGANAKFLRRHLLELPIHQDLDEAHLRYVARQVVEADVALSRTPVPSRRRPQGVGVRKPDWDMPRAS
jgi:dTDP-4-amino-4,6-dideoxygalactose transaminase